MDVTAAYAGMTPEGGRDGGVCRDDAGDGRDGGVCRNDAGGGRNGGTYRNDAGGWT